MQIALPQLPYAYDALEPYVSRETLEIHHGKHHQAYVAAARRLADEVRLADEPLERIIRHTAGQPGYRALFNNAAQAWNHAFYWRSLRPDGGGRPAGEIARRIEADLGGTVGCAEQLAAAAVAHFGCGWAWLVVEGGRLAIATTASADTPLAHGQTPLLAIDVWEHAYYLDYRNRRADYVAAVIEHLLDWEFAERNLMRWRTATHVLDAFGERV
jgi:Fe-Mn family superoxide dismutase